MKSFDWKELHQVICESVREYESAYDTLEFWLDTSSAKIAKQTPSMYLVFYGFTNHTDFDSVMEEVNETQDLQLLQDNVNDASEQTWFEFAQVDHDLSTGDSFISNNGEDQIVSEIKYLVGKESELFAPFSRIFLHWVDQPEIKWIKR